MDLYHFGVRGQKWGVRKNTNRSDTRSSFVKKGSSSSHGDNRRTRLKRAALLGSSLVVSGLAAYGVYKVSGLKRGVSSSASKSSSAASSIKDLLNKSLRDLSSEDLHSSSKTAASAIEELRRLSKIGNGGR